MKHAYEIKKRYIGECGMAALWLKDSEGREYIVAVEERVDVNSPFSLDIDLLPGGPVAARFPDTTLGWGRAMTFVDEVV